MNAPLFVAEGLQVIAVATPETTQRDSARQLIRQALTEALAGRLAVEQESISLLSAPGQAIRLAAPWQHVGISVAHEPGLSLAAIHLAGPVGVDLLRLGLPLPDIERLAADYLGPEAAAALAALPEARRPEAFTRRWTQLEAGLKCLGQPLQEWTPELGQRLAGCAVQEIVMAAGWVAAVAVPASREGG